MYVNISQFLKEKGKMFLSAEIRGGLRKTPGFGGQGEGAGPL